MDPIKERISKLLGMSKSPNENEAGVALAMAQTLMAKHNLSMAEVEDSKEEGIMEDPTPIFSAGRITTWKASLVNQIANLNGCKVVKLMHQAHLREGKRGASLIIFGRPTEIAVVRFMTTFAMLQITRLAPKKGMKKAWYLGAVQGFINKMTTAKQEVVDSATPFALVTLDQRCNKVNEFLTEVGTVEVEPSVEEVVAAASFYAGVTAGSEMDINDKAALTKGEPKCLVLKPKS